MSVKLSAWVWDGCAPNGISGTKLLVMVRLADFSSDEGACWPSIKTIARQINAGASTVRAAIRQLEKNGWLTSTSRRKGNRNDSNMYQLNVAKLRAAASAFYQAPESGGSSSQPPKTDAPESGASSFDPPDLSKSGHFHPPESGDDPSLRSDPSLKRSLKAENKKLSTEEFLAAHPEAVTCDPVSGMWGTEADVECATWFWSRLLKLYEKAAETDGEVVRPKEPNWTAWANDIRLMRTKDDHSLTAIQKLIERVQADSFWCSKILSPGALRSRWDQLYLQAKPAPHDPFVMSKVDERIPKGFRGYKAENAL